MKGQGIKIKGHTEIQLTNVKTGEVKTFHDDNMMTNGLAEFMKNHGMLCGTPFTDAVKNDLINTLLGGILLFDTALTENANNTRLTDGVKMTANACHGVTHTGDPTELGSYDSNESGWQNAAHTVYRHVFTWTTSQGNGTIACACLTSKAHGFVGEGNSTSKAATSDNNINMFTYASESPVGNAKRAMMVLDNEVYFIALDTSDDTITISKAHVTDTECDMRDVQDKSTAIDEEVLVINNPTSTPIGGMDWINCRVLPNSIVLAFCDYNNHRYIVLTLPTDFASLTSYVEVTQAATSLTFGNYVSFLNSDATKIIVPDSTGKLYTVALNNLANVSEIGNDGATIGACLVYSSGKRHYMVSAVYDETLGKIYPINNALYDYYYTSQDLYKDDKTVYSRINTNASFAAIMGRRNDYLATINNLSSVVTKDSTQTMKVIYTLTFTA